MTSLFQSRIASITIAAVVFTAFALTMMTQAAHIVA